METVRPDDIIWVHDYQLMLLPEMIRKEIPEATIGFFLHIPFPSMEVFRYLPWRNEILNGVLGADLIGFHTYDYSRHFLSCILRILGKEQNYGQIVAGDRVVKVILFQWASMPRDLLRRSLPRRLTRKMPRSWERRLLLTRITSIVWPRRFIKV